MVECKGPCCCLSLRIGVLIIAAFEITACGIWFIYTAFQTSNDCVSDGWSWPMISTDCFRTRQFLLFLVVQVIIGCLLLFGVLKKIPLVLYFWIGTQIFLQIVIIIFQLLRSYHNEESLMRFDYQYFFGFLLLYYCMHVVYYLKVEMGKKDEVIPEVEPVYENV